MKQNPSSRRSLVQIDKDDNKQDKNKQSGQNERWQQVERKKQKEK